MAEKENRFNQWDIIKDLKINQQTYSFGKDGKNMHWGKNWKPMMRKIALPYPSPCTKTSLKLIKNINLKPEVLKILEENRDYLSRHWGGQEISKQNSSQVSSEIETFSVQQRKLSAQQAGSPQNEKIFTSYLSNGS